MKLSDVEIGQYYDCGGYVVEAVEILESRVLIVCQEVGEELVKAGKLEKIER